jgi:hypothetical protein
MQDELYLFIYRCGMNALHFQISSSPCFRDENNLYYPFL